MSRVLSHQWDERRGLRLTLGDPYCGIEFGLDIPGARRERFEIEEAPVEQVCGGGVAERREHGFAQAGDLALQFIDQALDAPTLEILLRTAEVTRDDRVALRLGKRGDVLLPAIGQRPDDGV